MILITGSNGLIGHALRSTLIELGLQVRDFDIARSPAEDIRNGEALAAAIEDVEGIIHLAALSRIVWAERDPRLTEDVNVAPLRSLLAAASARTHRPWIIFASSREVYGEPSRLPVGEDAPFAPLNAYGRSKVAAERLLADARRAGLLANIVRFSNVYGSPSDHPDRVVPAFAQAAVFGGRVRVEGAENMFDFTHIDDVAEGMAAHVAATRAGEALPPIQFVTGKGTTLGALRSLLRTIAIMRSLSRMRRRAPMMSRGSLETRRARADCWAGNPGSISNPASHGFWSCIATARIQLPAARFTRSEARALSRRLRRISRRSADHRFHTSVQLVGTITAIIQARQIGKAQLDTLFRITLALRIAICAVFRW